MGAKICSECKSHNENHFQVSSLHPMIELIGHDDPNPEFARMENVKYEVSCNVNHILTDVPPIQYDKQLSRGKKIENSYFLILYSVYYTGEWKKGLPHGIGDVVFQNGSVLKGTFAKGKVQGKDCIYVMDDGSYYRGNIENNSFCGKGILKEQNGHIYDGQWQNNVLHGQGYEKFANGDSYEGTYVNGKKQGEKGIYQWAKHPQFVEYRGGFDNDQMYGEGILTKKKYAIKGIFRNCDIDKAVINSDKFSYEGQIKNGLLHGEGRMKNIMLNTIYEGHFENGQPHGLGKLRLASGEEKTGKWFKGNLIKDYKGMSDEEVQACIVMVEEQVESKIYGEDVVQSMNLRLKSAGYDNFVADLIDNDKVKSITGEKYLVVNMGPKTLQIKPR